MNVQMRSSMTSPKWDSKMPTKSTHVTPSDTEPNLIRLSSKPSAMVKAVIRTEFAMLLEKNKSTNHCIHIEVKIINLTEVARKRRKDSNNYLPQTHKLK